MPQTPWDAKTVAWLTNKLNELGETTATMPWVRGIMDDFYEACGQDPVLHTVGFTTKSEVLKAG